jgi:4-methyl-5(b-hydroxyethyl)-thiazole monophosphate biosynthesis
MVPLADGFEEIEAMTLIDVLRRAGIQVDMVGVVGSVIRGAHGVRVMTDLKLSDVKAEMYDGIILPGGNPGYANLAKTARLLEIVRRLNEAGKLVGAICAAPSVLAKAGVLEERRATIYPGMERQIPYPRPERVVIDGNIVTSQGPGTAMEFALKIVELLVGEAKSRTLARQLLA